MRPIPDEEWACECRLAPAPVPKRRATGCQQEASQRLKDCVVSLVCGVFNRSDDVFLLERRVIRKYFLEGSSRRKKLKDIGHTNAQPTNATPPAAFPFLHRNPLQPLVVHTPKITCLALKWQGRGRVLPLGLLPGLEQSLGSAFAEQEATHRSRASRATRTTLPLYRISTTRSPLRRAFSMRGQRRSKASIKALVRQLPRRTHIEINACAPLNPLLVRKQRCVVA
jgi:hypothetical protein